MEVTLKNPKTFKGREGIGLNATVFVNGEKCFYYIDQADVAFSISGTWQYFDEDFNSFVFDNKINVSILEAAVDSVSERPAIFQIGNE